MTTQICVLVHRKDPERQRRALDGLRICAGCLARVRRELEQLPVLDVDLIEGHNHRGPAAEKTTGTHAEPLPINEKIADHRAHMQSVLASWARDVAEKRGLHPPADFRTATSARFLLTHADWIAAQDFVADYDDEIHALHRRAWSLAYPTNQRSYVIKLLDGSVARCEVGDCVGVLTAILRDQDDLMPSEIVCSLDESHSIPSSRWYRWGESIIKRRTNPDAA